MRAVHWLRTRQEERELTYWLSIVAYEYRDRSITNRLYLLYLIIFFSGWIFITLTLVASGGAEVLRSINPDDPAQTALHFEMAVLGAWTVYGLWQSTRRSPVTFSEQDAVLLCQTPVSRPSVTLRWLLMPWFKNAVLFGLLAVAIGFSYAEMILPEFTGFDRILEYSGYGFRSLITVVPVHLALYLSQWIYGVYRLQQDIERRWMLWPVVLVGFGFLAFLFVPSIDATGATQAFWSRSLAVLSLPLQGGFGLGSLTTSMTIDWILVFTLVGVLIRISGVFSLSRAAQETQAYVTRQSMLQYGLTSAAAEKQTKERMGMSQAPSRLPAPAGPEVLLWKGLLQSRRSFRFRVIFDWFAITGLMFGLALLPDTGSRAFAAAIWVTRLANLSVVRLRSDLARWSIVRQLPIHHRKLILYELLPVFTLAVVLSAAAVIAGSVLFDASVTGLAAVIPGVIAGVAGVAAYDVLRRAKTHLLLNASAPDVSALGVIAGLIFALVPLGVYLLLPGALGTILAATLSVALGWLAFNLAVRAYRRIDAV